jgi:GDPmannose 4,6-dehydratase
MKAIVIGSAGQDGRLMSEQLEAEGHSVIGVQRHTTDIHRPDAVRDLISSIKPDQVYYLAAYHHSSEQRPGEPAGEIRKSMETNLTGLLNVLDAVRQTSPSTRVFYAGSSRVFGQRPPTPIQDETTPFHPDCAYGISKAAGIDACRFYRRQLGVFAATGILYNHESIYRGNDFVSRKITRAAVAAARGEVSELALRDISALADWGYAPDYVRAMRATLALNTPDDFIVATGESHSVAEFAEIAFDSLALDWKKFIREQNDGGNPSPPLIGNASKLRGMCGWRPSLQFPELVRTLVAQEKERSNGVR